MTRRTLEEGLEIKKRVESEEGQRFIKGQASTKQHGTPKPSNEKAASKDVLPQMVGRKSLTIKLQPEVASDLKRLSLMRQLEGIEPHTMQDMAEEAITVFLKKQN